MKKRTLLLALPFLIGCQSEENTPEFDSNALVDTAKSVVVAEPIEVPVDIIPTAWLSADCSINLPTEVKTAIEKYDPNFITWALEDFTEYCGAPPAYVCSEKQVPFAVVADFNGDSINDVALYGHNKTNDLLIAAISSESGYKVVEIITDEYLTDLKTATVGIFIEHFEAQTVVSHYEEKTLKMTSDGFHLFYCEKASELYYYKDGAFLSYAISD